MHSWCRDVPRLVRTHKAGDSLEVISIQLRDKIHKEFHGEITLFANIDRSSFDLVVIEGILRGLTE